jgi:hypothetical protein
VEGLAATAGGGHFERFEYPTVAAGEGGEFQYAVAAG